MKRWLGVIRKRSIWKTWVFGTPHEGCQVVGMDWICWESTRYWAKLVMSTKLCPNSDVSFIFPLAGELFYYILFSLLSLPCARMDSLRQFILESSGDTWYFKMAEPRDQMWIPVREATWLFLKHRQDFLHCHQDIEIHGLIKCCWCSIQIAGAPT